MEEDQQASDLQATSKYVSLYADWLAAEVPTFLLDSCDTRPLGPLPDTKVISIARGQHGQSVEALSVSCSIQIAGCGNSSNLGSSARDEDASVGVLILI